jgi:MinD-like ATPase involved in chromosome partitioning or flagellar assembly
MSIVVVAGDCSTTTALLLAATWPEESQSVVVEANPRGGSLSAWLSVAPTPSLTTAVTSIVADASRDGWSRDGWSRVEPFMQPSPSGVRVLVSPVRSLEATRAVMEAETALFPLLAGMDVPVAVIDAGDPILSQARPAALSHADVVVIVHRQSQHSARSAAVRIERVAEQVETLSRFGVEVWILIIGNDPFDPVEIGSFVDPSRRSTLVVLPEDDLAAAALAGRAGVSAKRFSKLPLVRAGREVASLLEATISSSRYAISGGEIG